MPSGSISFNQVFLGGLKCSAAIIHSGFPLCSLVNVRALMVQSKRKGVYICGPHLPFPSSAEHNFFLSTKEMMP